MKQAEPDSIGGIEPTPDVATAVFGSGMDRAVAYAALLAGDGAARGVIGPGEASRVWSRHLLNCAVVAEGMAEGASVVDIGSGAGLPGIPLAIARPDLTMILVEPLQRRVDWLRFVVERLHLSGAVTVVHGRAESERAHRADVVVSRAVAPLSRLLPWCLPWAVTGGTVMAIKGASAHQELAAVSESALRWGLADMRVARFGAGLVSPPTTTIMATRSADAGAATAPGGRRGGTARRRHP